jgi:predicted AlkP superfamily phosphohydrolase/phosphomutase
MSRADSSRVVLIGLDGATFSILNPLMADGIMPFLKEFAGQGVHGVLHSTPHPLTPPAWTSLQTGRSPGNHGVFDFVRVERQEFDRSALDAITQRDGDSELAVALLKTMVNRQATRAALDEAEITAPTINILPDFEPDDYERTVTRVRATLAALLDLGLVCRFRVGEQVLYKLAHPSYTLGTSADNRCETIWSIASRQGCRVTTLNFPCTFPPPSINGFVVPAFVPWSYLPRAVHPPDLYARLKSQPDFNSRELAMDWDIERKALQGLPEEEFDSWIRFHTVREQQWFGIARYLMREEPCDLTAVLFDGVDKLQHLCYHLLDPRLASQATSVWARHIRSLCLDYFRQLDGFLEQIVSMAGREARVFIASDHGFTAAGDRIFYANVWLQQHGYLEWADAVPLDKEGHVTLEGFTETGTLFNWSRTTAFALTPSSNAIYIRRSKFPGAPGVPVEEYPAFRQHLIQSLLAFTDPNTGQPVIERILTPEEAFPGACTGEAPDMTLVLPDLGLLSVLRADAALKPRRSPYGTHHPHGIFFARGPGIRTGIAIPSLSILDIAPTLLYGLGLPVPSDMEGAVAVSAFEPPFVNARPIRKETASLSTRTPRDEHEHSRLEAEETAEVLERFRALGYL